MKGEEPIEEKTLRSGKTYPKIDIKKREYNKKTKEMSEKKDLSKLEADELRIECEKWRKLATSFDKTLNERDEEIRHKDEELRLRDDEIGQREQAIRELKFINEERAKNIEILATRRDTPRSINHTQPTFSGKTEENIDMWIYTTETNLTVANINETDRPTYASTFLRDVALQYYRQLTSTGSISWTQFKQRFRERFQAANYNEVLLDKLDKLHQTGNVAEYIENFMYLINQAREVSEIMKIHLFRKNLKPTLSAEIRYKRPTTLNEACNMAIEYEDSFCKRNPYKSDYGEVLNTGFKNETSSKYCSFCHRRGHIKQECYKMKGSQINNNNNKQNKEDNFNYRNNNSNKYNNHNYRRNNGNNFNQKRENYASNKSYDNQNNNYNNYDNKDNKNTDNSYNYNSKKTIIPRSINQVKQEKAQAINMVETNEFLTTIALIHDQETEVLFDTGAKMSVISYNTVKKNNIPFHKTNQQCSLGNGATDRIIGVTEFIRVIVHGSICEMEFMILPRHNTLLGIDWFNAVKAHVETYKHKLVFAKREIILTNTDSDEEINLAEINSIDQDDDNEEIIEQWDSNKTPLEIKTNSELTKEQNDKFNEIISKNEYLFARTYLDLKSPCSIYQFRINTTSDQPIRIQPYRRSYKEKLIIQDEIYKMLEAKIIRPSQSPWSFPVVLITKPDGSSRFCVDYRKLNAITLLDPFPMPRIDDILSRMNKCKWFTAIDLKSGYWQIEMDPRDIDKTAFCTTDGHYEFLRLPFGLKNAPPGFSRVMFQIFGDLPYVEIYIDDIVIHSETFEQHVEHVKMVLNRLDKASLKINITKCKWFFNEIKILGHILNGETIKMNPEKIEAIKRWRPPRNVLEVQQFLGLCNFYRRFIQDFAKIAAPLYKLTRNDVLWEWSENCNHAFYYLKERLITYPILRQPDLSKEFILETDASNLTLGAILSQEEEIKKPYVCEYASKMLKGAEIHYCVTEKECLAIIWAIKLFRVYLHGTHFIIITDHAALQWLMNIKEPTGRLARWAIYIQTFDFEIRYRAGRKHKNVDALSRPLLNIDINNRQEDENDDPFQNIELLKYINTRETKGIHNPELIKKFASHYILYQDTIRYRHNINDSKYNWIVPKIEDREHMIMDAHLLGHFSATTVYDRLRQKYYWKNMLKEIQAYLSNCLPCLRHQNFRIQEHPALAIPITGILDRIQLDLVFGLPETENGNKGILVIMEALTKYPYAIAIKTKSANEIARKFFNFMSVFGPPKEILTDQGREFMNQVLAELINLVGVEHRVTSAYHPRTNGLTERFNQTLINSLKKHTEDNPLNWEDWIPFVLLAYRSRVNTITKFTPYELMFGRKMNGFENWNTPLNQDDEYALYQRSIILKRLYEHDVPQVLKEVKESQQQQIIRQEKQHHITEESLQPGTKVFLKSLKLQGKLEAKYQGPYIIVKQTKNGNYWLKTTSGKKLQTSYPLSRLKIAAETVNDDDSTFEIEKVLDERIHKGIKEYLVKWKGFTEMENSWVKESNMNAPEAIEEFI